MSRMSEVHDDLASIHAILLGQRKVAQAQKDYYSPNADVQHCEYTEWSARVACIDDLLLEFEAAGVVWPDNVVDISPQSAWDKGQEVWSHD